MDDANPNQPLTMIDNETGELVPIPKSLDEIARAETGGISHLCWTSANTDSPGGQELAQKLYQANPPKNHKQNEGWYGRIVKMVAFMCRGIRITRDLDGKLLGRPKNGIRTVIMTDEGEFMASGSNWLYDSLKIIVGSRGNPSSAHPIKVRLIKGGHADKLECVYDDERPTAKKK